MAALLPYTRFPDLSTNINLAPRRNDTPFPTLIVFTDKHINQEILIIAWAYLLKCYTLEEDLKFVYNGRDIISYSLDSWTTETFRAKPGSESAFTGIFVDHPLPTQVPAFYLTCKSDTGEAIIGGAATNLQSHLPQLALQFRRAIRYAQTFADAPQPHFEQQDCDLSILNPSPQLINGPKLLHQLFEKHSESEILAIDHLEQNGNRTEVTYGQLHRRSSSLARRIRSASHNPAEQQCVVPILLPQCPDLYLAQLAILKAGGAFCPLPLDAPEERIRFIIDDVSAKVVLTTHELRHKLPDIPGVRILVVGEDSANETRQPFSSDIMPTDLAYVLYTSGTTGLPKGVAMSHQAASQALLAHESLIPQFHRFLQFAAPTFDVSIFEIFFTLFRGATIVSCDRQNLLGDLPKVMRTLEVDGAELTPTVAGALLKSRSNVPKLKILLTIGEMLSRSVVAEFGGDDLTEGILHGMYGPTEAAIHCTAQVAFRNDHKTGIVGKPFETVSTFIVDTSSDSPEIMPIGQVGELAVGGHQLAEGYINQNEQTDKVFFQHETYGRLYLTGDRARILPDRTIECLGRIAEGQVKLRGQRLELGEIEQIASKVDGIDRTIAAVIDDNLILFCVQSRAETTSEAVLSRCKQWLPRFMVPSDLVMLESLPQSSAGKTDIRKLEANYRNRVLPMIEDIEAPVGEMEEQGCNTASKFFDQKIGPNTSFSHFGLDSLRAIRLSTQFRMVNIVLPATDLLFADCVRACIQHSEHPNEKLNNDDTVDNRHNNFVRSTQECRDLGRRFGKEIANIFACSPIQISMLVETAKSGQAYCNSVELKLANNFSIDQVKSAFGSLAQHNEVLRSGFIATNDARNPFAQVVWKTLADAQLQEVSTFSRSFLLSSENDFLRPFRVQLIKQIEGVQILVHIHHAIYDGWSWDIIISDLARLLTGTDLQERTQYREVSNFINNSINANSANIRRSIEYWKSYLVEVDPAHLPNLTGRQMTSKSSAVATQTMKVKLKKLKAGANDLDCHPQTILHGALAYLLGSYTASTDVLFAYVTSGRTIPVSGVEDVVGPCIATLPLRVNISDSTTIRNMLGTIHKMVREQLKHSIIPFNDIVKSSQLGNGRVLCDTLIVWQESLEDIDHTHDIVAQIEARDYLEYKLLLAIEPRDENIRVSCTFLESIIPKAHVVVLLRQLDTVVNYFLDHLDESISDLPLSLGIDDLSIANPFPISPRMESLVSAVEKRAKETPEHPALLFAKSITKSGMDSSYFTYKELNDQANRLAHHVIGYGIKPNDLVCICMEKSIDLYVSILAILKTGAGYLPLTPDTPNERIDYILEEAKIGLCITNDAACQRVLALQQRQTVNWDHMELSNQPATNLEIPHIGGNIAYVIFTSGSTGTPKGVQVTQDNLASNLAVLGKIYPITSSQPRLLQSCSQAFDVSVFEIFFSWYTGMCLCSATKDVLFRDLEAAIISLRITHLSLTPTVAALVDPTNVPGVEMLVTAGEAVTEQVFRKWADQGLFQGYGPSETTNICTVQKAVRKEDSLSLIGPPFSNTSAFVLDTSREGFHLLPKGAMGEFCFGGDQVFRGYLNQSKLTASKIIEHPEYGRLYRSGDLGRMLDDGSLIISGRLDDQVKVRGQRIELGEINSVLLSLDFVQDCTTIVLGSAQEGTQQLISYWIPAGRFNGAFDVLTTSDDMKETIAIIFSRLQEKLPLYMCPTALLPVTSIPRTAQGKTDRRKLGSAYEDLETKLIEAFSGGSQDVVDDDVGEWSDAEQLVLQALRRTLQSEDAHLGRHSSFYSLGIDSISAISFAKNIRALSKDHNVDVSTVLRNPTIGRLAVVIQNPSHDLSKESFMAPLSEIFSKETRSRLSQDFPEADKILPCTPLQEAMISVDGSQGSSTYYNKTVFKVNGSTDRLRKAWETMVERHEILRTCFATTVDTTHPFAQIVLKKVEVPWVTLTGASATDVDLNSRMQPITSKVPPFALVVRIDPRTEESLLDIYMHHALYDGVALSILYEEIQIAYSEKILPTCQVFDPFLRSMLSLDLSKADEFWASMLQDFEPTEFPDLTGKSSSYRKSLSGYSVTRNKLDISLGKLERDCKKSETSLLTVCQAAWVKIITSYSGQSDVCFGNVVSGRTLPLDHLDRLVAPCFNTLPVRVKLTAKTLNIELLQNLQNVNSESLPYQLTPLRRIQARAMAERQSLFDTLFILQQPSNVLDSDIWELREDIGEMDVPIVCEVCPNYNDDTLTVTLHCDRSIILEQDAGLICETFKAALLSSSQQPQMPALEVGEPDEKLLAISNINATSVETKHGGLLHSAFEHQVAALPNYLALDFLSDQGDHIRLSFKELNEQANNIAHALKELGAQIEEAIPICVSKAPFFYASILGVLKAGAAFTPFDPSAPADRKLYMAGELKARFIICTPDVDMSWCHDLNLKKLDPAAIEQSFERSIDFVHTTIQPSNLAYRLYTSGSTGQPKAVNVEHRNAVQTIESSRSRFPWSQDSRLLQFASVTFDMCYYDCFLAWSFGFTLCAAPQAVMFGDLVKTIGELNITVLDLTPAVASTIKRTAIPSVKSLYCIGEALPQRLVKDWKGSCINSYGPTEAAMCVTIYPTAVEVNSAVFGRPFPTTSFKVVQKHGTKVVPVLAVGELYIGGSQIARGYFANDGLTRSQFLVHDGQRFYKSGDMVRKLASGDFEFVGRIDDQVKIRGLRVELDEINSVLKEGHDSIADVNTQILKVSENSKDQLVSFLVLHSGTVDKDEIQRETRQHALRKLPQYMIPTDIIVVKSLPLSVAGKIDKKTLTQIYREEGSPVNASHSKVQPEAWNNIEKAILNVFAALSGINRNEIQKDTTIFRLGLDSISAVQVATELRHQGIKVSAGDILENPTISKLASKCNDESDTGDRVSNDGSEHDIYESSYNFEDFEAQHRSEVARYLGISDVSLAYVRPCTPVQAGMIARFINTDGAEYFNHSAFRLNESVDASRFCDAWSRVFERHDVLRTGFVHIESAKTPFAMVTYTTKSSEMPFSVTKCSSAEEVWNQRAEWTAEVHRNLHNPAWRVNLVSIGVESWVFFSAHHALYDARSLDLIFHEVFQAYKGKRLSPLPSIEPQLGIILQAGDKDNESSKAFWTEQGTKTTVNKFPSMTPLHVKDNRSHVVSKTSAKSCKELETGCKDREVTVQAVAQAAWAQVLSSYLGEENVTFGIVLSGRNTEEAQRVALPCITTIPLSISVDKSHEELLQSMMTFNAAVQKHQFAPLSKIQRWMGQADSQLFDTLLVFQRGSIGPDETLPWSTEIEESSVDYPISIEYEISSDGRFIYRLSYKVDQLPDEQAQLLLDQLDAHFTSLALNESFFEYDTQLCSVTPPKDYEIVSDVLLMHDFVANSAKRFPSKAALEFATSLHDGKVEKASWTYKELDRHGNRVANTLINIGIKQGTIVAICFDKCPEASFAILGILKAGCAFLALDPGAPPARKEFIIEDSNTRVILTTSDFKSRLPHIDGVQIIALDKALTDDTAADSPSLKHSITPQDTSYCLYTSGTTGTPKGCELTHENGVQFIKAFQRLLRWSDTSKMLQFASFHFDVSVMEHFFPWSVGMTLASAPRDLMLEDLANTIRQLEITHIDLTPSLAQLMDPEDVPSLCRPDSVFITGGESLKQEIIEKWGSHEVIHNGYGPTEVTIGMTMYPRVPLGGRPANIGMPYDNCGTFIFKRGTTTPVLRGGVGELCAFGKLVAKGYLNREELTKERFPMIDFQGRKERFYRTGDLVRVLHNGQFDFLGRVDDQVKLRGQRLEIGEINNVMKNADSSIEDVSTLVLKHPQQQKDQLVAFVSSDKFGNKNSAEEICFESSDELLNKAKDATSNKLPSYMIPTHIIPLKHLPLSANNKIDGKHLKKLYEELPMEALNQRTGMAEPFSKDITDDETEVIEVLQQSLDDDISEIGKSSNVFQLGLDSISVIAFVRALKKAGYQAATTSLVMKNATIDKITAALKSDSNNGTSSKASTHAAKQAIVASQHRYLRVAAEVLDVAQTDIECVAHCTPLQQGIISRSLDSNQPLYYEAFRFELLPEVDVQKLRNAFSEVQCNTQILRTSFFATEDGFMQAVLKDVQLPWIETDIDDRLESYLDEKHQKWYESDLGHFNRPYEILLTNYKEKRILTLHILHALYDGNSLQLMMQKLFAHYYDEDPDYGPSFHEALPFGPLQDLSESKGFWEEHLKQAAVQHLAPLTEQPAAKDTLVSMHIVEIPGFEECRRKLNTTHQALIQACWSSVMQSQFGGPTTLGLVVSGRSIDLEGADNVIGPLFNTIPFYLKIDRKETWASAILKCHDFNTAAIAYQHTPLRSIQKWRQSRETIFESLFVFQKQAPEDKSRSPIWKAIDEHFVADYPMSFDVEQTNDNGLNLTLATQSYLSNETKSLELLRTLERTMQQAFRSIDSLIADALPLLDDIAHSTTNGHANGQKNETVNGQTNGYANGQTNGRANGHSDGPSGSSIWTEEAGQIRDVIANLASVETSQLSLDSSILELGLDSIDAVKLSSRLKKSSSLSLSVSSIMRSLTIGKMASLVETTKEQGKSEDKSQSLEQQEIQLRQYFEEQQHTLANIVKILPATPLQEAMLAEMVHSDFESYFNHSIHHLLPDTNIDRLKGAWQNVIDQSPILRTSFAEVDSLELDLAYAQLIQPPKQIEWLDCEINDADDYENVFAKTKDMARQEFLGQPPIKLTLIRKRDSKTITHLALSIAHALYDGWSLGLLHQDVAEAYNGKFETRPAYEAPLRDLLSVARDGQAQTFWNNQLSGLSSTTIKLRPSTDEISETYRNELHSQISLATIQDFCKRYGVTIGAIAQTAWSFVLASHTRQLDVGFGVVLSCRKDEEANEVMFPLMNTVLLRTVLHGTRKEMVRYVQETQSAISQYDHFPLRRAQTKTNRSADRLFDSLFIYQKRPSATTQQSQSPYETVGGASDVEYPVAIEIEVGDENLVWRNACKSSAFDEIESEGLLKTIDLVMQKIISEPEVSTIEYIDNQVQICGLEAFTEEIEAGEDEKNDTVEVTRTSTSWSGVEVEIRSVLAQVSKTDEMGIQKTATLFHLGLDSISAIKVSSLLRKKSLRLSVGVMLKAGTLEKMASLVEVSGAQTVRSIEPSHSGNIGKQNGEAFELALQNVDLEEGLSRLGVSPSAVDYYLPAAAGQAFLLSSWSNEGLFFPTFRYNLRTVPTETLSKAWKTLVSQLPVLRTVFFATKSTTAPLVQVVMSTLDGFQSRKEEFLKNTIDEVVEPCSPYVIFRAKQISSGIDLSLQIHHALYDGNSLPEMMKQLERLCGEDQAPIPKCTAFDEMIAISCSKSSEVARKDFWTDYLRTITTKRIHSRHVGKEKAPQRVSKFQPGFIADVSAIRKLGQEAGVSIQAIFMAAYAKIYAQITRTRNDSDVVIGMYLGNRSHAIQGIDEVIAPTLNLVPIRVRQPLQKSVSSVAQQIQEDLRIVSEMPNSSVAIWELDNWTEGRVKIDTWINFWRVLDNRGYEAPHVEGGGLTEDASSEGMKNEEWSGVSDAESTNEHPLLEKALLNNVVKDSYIPSIDVEAAVSNGKLSVGLFGPASLMNMEDAEKLMADLKSCLERLQ